MSTYIEKRKHARFRRKIELRYFHNGQIKDGIVQDLSLGGIAFRTKHAVLLNTPLQFIFELPMNKGLKKCVLHGKVIRIKHDPYGFWPEIGCQFAYSSNLSLKILDEFFASDQTAAPMIAVEKVQTGEPKFKYKDPRRPTWWTHPGASLSKINQTLLKKKKSLSEWIRAFFKSVFPSRKP